MASNINETNINGNYPVAGQDNNSQGFRDNFSSIRNNLSIAGEEITDLQSKVVLKSALTGEELDNDLGGSVIKNAELRGSRETVVPLGTTSGTVNIDYANGSFFTLSSSGNITLEFDNFPSGDAFCSVVTQITITDTAHTVSLPSAVGTGATEKSTEYIIGLDSSNIISFTTTGTYVFEFTTTDGGSSIFINDLIRSNIEIDIDNVVGNLAALSDVEISNVTGNNFLVYNSANSKWENSALSINNISEIEISGLQNNDFLVYNSANSQWENNSIELNNLSDITTTSLTTGDFLRYENDKWVNVSDEFIYPAENFTVTVADDGSDFQEVFYIDGTAIKDFLGNGLNLTFEQNKRYRFDVSDPSNEDAPLRFSTEPDTIVEPENGGLSTVQAYNNNVIISGNAGTAGAYVEILITDETPSPLYFYGLEVGVLDTSKIGGELPIYTGDIEYYYGHDKVSSNSNISLNSSVTLITTSDDLSLTLNQGAEGQRKTIAYANSSVGNTAIAVNNSIWGGNLSIANVGSTVTLQYVDSNWYVVSSNDITIT